MKRKCLIVILSALLVFAFAAYGVNFFYGKTHSNTMTEIDKTHLVLTKLWTEYENARKADRPAKQMEILSQIKKEASSKRLSWDFYSAAQRYVEVGSSRNWKMTDSLQSEFAREVADYDEPICSFVHTLLVRRNQIEAFDYAIKHRANLEISKNEGFYSIAQEGTLGKFKSKFYTNDYQYALWVLLGNYSNLYGGWNDSNGYDKSPVYKELVEYERGSYPLGAFLEYLPINIPFYRILRADDIKKLEDFADKYEGKAVSLWAKQDILQARFKLLGRNEWRRNALSLADEYKKLYEDCRTFELERQSFDDREYEIVEELSDVTRLISTLTEESVRIEESESGVDLYVRNVSNATLSIRQAGKNGKEVFHTSIENTKNSFYVTDTLRVAFPAMDDGDYEIIVKARSKYNYDFSRHRISLATRNEHSGIEIYAADWITGRPVDTATIMLYSYDEKLQAEYPGFEFNGFTLLPEQLSKDIKSGNYFKIRVKYVASDGKVRMSRAASLRTYPLEDSSSASQRESRKSAYIYTDRGAYNPGETVEFKVVAYESDGESKVSVLPEGHEVSVTLFNAENKKVHTVSGRVNAFGSFVGRFVLPESERNGRFRMEVYKPGQIGSIGSKTIVVDEFILPTFDLSFDRTDKLCLAGDRVEVRGKIARLDGHSVSDVKMRYSVQVRRRVEVEGEINPDKNGAFTISFPTKSDNDYGWLPYNVVVTVTDNTGETHEYSKLVWVTSSIEIMMTLLNSASGQSIVLQSLRQLEMPWDSEIKIINGDAAKLKLTVSSPDDIPVPIGIDYELSDEKGRILLKSKAQSGMDFSMDMSGHKSGIYLLTASASVRTAAGKDCSAKKSMTLIYVREDDKGLDAPISDFMRLMTNEVAEGEDIRFQIGNADGAPMWALVELSGRYNKVLERRLIWLEGIRGASGSLTEVRFRCPETDDHFVLVNVFYFRNKVSIQKDFSCEIRRKKTSLELPFAWTRFVDKTSPGKECTMSFKTSAETEALVAVFDKSTELIYPNRWEEYRFGFRRPFGISISSYPGRSDLFSDMGMVELEKGVELRSRGIVNYSMKAKASDADSFMEGSEVRMLLNESEEIKGANVEEPVKLREDFADVLTFQPLLRSDHEGNISFTFNTSDKLSTYIVAAFLHDKSMRNVSVRNEMVVSTPVRIALQKPQFLYEGDVYELSASISSAVKVPVSGKLTLSVYPSNKYQDSKPLASYTVPLVLPAGESISKRFPIKVSPEMVKSGKMGVKLIFEASTGLEGFEGGFSDGMFDVIPVYPCAQTLVESHSAILLSGMDKDALADSLRRSFVNVSPEDAIYKEISIIDMIKEALPEKSNPAAKDVLSLSEALYVRKLATSLGANLDSAANSDEEKAMSDEELLKMILECRNSDGGFAWFKGMKSSTAITTMMLERFAKMSRAGILIGVDMSSSVKYLDKMQFEGESCLPIWCGGVDDWQYMYVRSMYPEVSFSVSSGRGVSKRFKLFREEVNRYLVPKGERGLQGRISEKVRRLATLRNLTSSNEGKLLASDWGLSWLAVRRMGKSLTADVQSLVEYAQDHKDGCVYYPNLVMPFRGLMSSEAYCHSMLCDLFTSYSREVPDDFGAGRIADGIRIWLMLQKETQHWDSTPEFVDAINSVMNGDDKVKATKALVYSKKFTKPFEEILSAGNGFSVERKYCREVVVRKDGELTGENDRDMIELQEIAPGEKLSVGDKVIAIYKIHSDENRSFVKLTIPREAMLRPVNQLSGTSYPGLSPLRFDNWYVIRPMAYRNVKTKETEYYFDSYPEEWTEIKEEYHVTQSGEFTAPVVEIESLYAPHYRANGEFGGRMISK